MKNKIFFIKFVIPEAVAFYLANGYSRNCLSDCPLINHINAALDIFNVRYNVDELMPEIELILKIKYNLEITKNKSLELMKVV